MLVHLDVDVIDPSVGKATFTIASFNPLQDGDESAKRLAALSIKGVGVVLDGLEKRGLL
ncbi:hypothetical protein VTI28DRAFT_9119 [Corynascus sepedonium]